ncbi:hypothetical protein Y032_0919g3043 [Ancylostoma ceylanicum]|uniref:Uncharacterized protein n=1 Tax=Ancylostoma ceylanicum TaxID=53326 RepID=A0A016W9C7_9BILA|nr:hypothetical protein Y032_0919g3043 [Ancylostoma ceylanicum]
MDVASSIRHEFFLCSDLEACALENDDIDRVDVVAHFVKNICLRNNSFTYQWHRLCANYPSVKFLKACRPVESVQLYAYRLSGKGSRSEHLKRFAGICCRNHHQPAGRPHLG